MAIIWQDESRPALAFADGRLIVGEGPWREQMEGARARIEGAARAVARVEVEHGVMPWVGTAALIAPRLALTAWFVGDALRQRAPTDAPRIARLNFVNDPAAGAHRAVTVAAVEQVHPYWRFCFLVLAEPSDIPPIAIAERQGVPEELAGREIAVIGFPSFDQRNPDDVQRRIFGNVFDVKRAAPGKITAVSRAQLADPINLVHDASTLGGCSGAPLIDLQSGAMLGLHIGGRYLDANQAACAWDARADPQWERLWSEPAEPPPAGVAAPSAGKFEPIFSYDDISTLYDLIMLARITDESGLQLLFRGLSPEFLGAIPIGSTIGERLERALDFLNNRRLRYADKPPLFYVLSNAKRRLTFDASANQAIDSYLRKLS